MKLESTLEKKKSPCNGVLGVEIDSTVEEVHFLNIYIVCYLSVTKDTQHFSTSAR